jgi:hypothetical protein
MRAYDHQASLFRLCILDSLEDHFIDFDAFQERLRSLSHQSKPVRITTASILENLMYGFLEFWCVEREISYNGLICANTLNHREVIPCNDSPYKPIGKGIRLLLAEDASKPYAKGWPESATD